MPDLMFSQAPTNANEICARNPDTLEQFLQCNPHLSSPTITMPGHSVYDTSSNVDIASRIITQQFNSLSIRSRQKLTHCIADYGDDTLAIAEFYHRQIEGFELPDVAQNAGGIAGVGAAVMAGRVSSFQNALVQYQEALVKLHRHSRVGRVAGAQKIELRRQVTQAYDRLNWYYQQELRRVVPSRNRTRNRGTALSNVDRGITLAERSRGHGIHIADMHEGQKVSRFSNAMTYAGRGLIAVDVGFRGAKVHQSYQNDEDWKREIAVQTGGLGGASVGGITAGRVAFGLSRIALAATPLGWAVLIGSAVVMGGVLAYQLDKQGQSIVGNVWDKIFGR